MNDQTQLRTDRAIVIREDEQETTEFDWGRITFFANGALAPATEQSLGHCEINPGPEPAVLLISFSAPRRDFIVV